MDYLSLEMRDTSSQPIGERYNGGTQAGVVDVGGGKER